MLTDVPDSPYTLALRPGAVLADRFRLQRPLQGGSPYAITYRAEDLTRGEAVVVKEFFPRSLVSRAADGVAVRPHSPEDERNFVRALRRFEIEGSVLAEIAHPHVVRARGLVDANGTAYLVMDHHQSQSLAEYVQANGGRLPAAQAGRIVQHLLTALEPLHGESIIHRDLSPRSVHVHGDGALLLLEFSARRHLPLHGTDLAAGFAAFEQYGMRDVGPWTDVYAASALLYYLLTGMVPPSALDRAAGEALPSPTALVPTLSPGLTRLILRGMALLPQQRPHAASELRRQLEASLGEGVITAPRSPQNVSSLESYGPFGEGGPAEGDNRATTLKLAASGIVLPGDEANGSLIRKLGNAAARFRRTPIVTPPLPPQIARDDRMSAPSDDEERRAAPTREPAPMPVQQAPMPMEPVAVRQQAEVRNDRAVYDEPQPIPTTALVPADERSLPVAGQRPRPLDIAMQIALATRDVDMEYAAPSRRRQYGLAAAGALVIVVGGSLALLARNGSASSSGIRTEPPAQSSAVGPTVNAASPAPSAVPVTHQVEEAGTLLQSSRPETKSSSARMAADTPRPKAPVPAVQKPASGAPRNEPVLPAGPLPNVRVAMPGATPDLKIVSPEMLVDVRTRLTNGQDQLEQGDFAVARRTFRLAVQQLDSIAARYPESEKIRGLRRDLDQADARALQACGAVNEMRKRRGEQGKACQ